MAGPVGQAMKPLEGRAPRGAGRAAIGKRRRGRRCRNASGYGRARSCGTRRRRALASERRRPGSPSPMPNDCDDHAFVLKLYCDDERQLRGRITHAESRRGQATRHPEDVLVFLTPYLASMGVRLRPKSRLLLWLSRPRLASKPPAPETRR